MVFGRLFTLLVLSLLTGLVCSLAAMPVTALAYDTHEVGKLRRGEEYRGIDNCEQGSGRPCKRGPVPWSGRATSGDGSTAQTSGAGSTSATTTAVSSSAPSGSTGAVETSTASSSSNSADSSSGNSTTSSNSSSSTSGSGKVGLAWSLGDDPSLSNFVTPNVRYIYTWNEMCPPKAKEAGLECIPMLWSGAQEKIDPFKKTVVQGYANIAAGFNEVDNGGQANMDVQSAIKAWLENLEPLTDQGYKLLSPSTTSDPRGFDWMKEFISGCKTSSGEACSIDGITVHYYGTSADDMITYIEKWQSEFQKPIWVTEFACQDFGGGPQCDESQIDTFYTKMMDYLEGNANVTAWMPFGFMHDMVDVNPLNQMMNPDGTPNDLGNAIINLSFDGSSAGNSTSNGTDSTGNSTTSS